MCKRKCRLDIRKLTEQYFGSLFLCFCPFVGRHHQQRLAPRQQLCPCLLVLQSLRTKLRIASEGVSVLVNPRTVILYPFFHSETMLLTVVGILCHLFPTILPAHFLQSFKTELLMVKPVKCEHGFWEASFHDAVHTLGKVKRHFYNVHSQ